MDHGTVDPPGGTEILVGVLFSRRPIFIVCVIYDISMHVNAPDIIMNTYIHIYINIYIYIYVCVCIVYII